MKSIAKPISTRAWIIWLLGALFFLMEYFVRISPSVIPHQLMSTFKVNALALGGVSAFFYYAYLGMQIPVGFLVDKYGPRKLMVAATIACAIGNLLFAISTQIEWVYLSRFIIGFGAAFAFVGTLKLVTNWFDSRYFALITGITQALGMLGATIGDAPMAYIFGHFGWRQTYIAIALLFVLMSFLMAGIIRNHPKVPIRPIRKSHAILLWPSFKRVLQNKQTWLNGLFCGLLYAPTAAFAGLWGVSFLEASSQVSTTLAASQIGMIFIGMAIGCPIFGWWSSRIQSRLWPMRISAIVGFLLISLIIYRPMLPHLISQHLNNYMLAFLYGLSNGGIIPSYAVGAEVNPRKLSGLSIGFTNMASVIIGAIFIPLIGAILDALWQGKTIHGAPFYSVQSYEKAFVVFPLCFIVAYLISLWIRETHCQNISHN